MERVSIIAPVYNEKENIKRFIERRYKRKYTIVKLNEKIFIWGIKNYG